MFAKGWYVVLVLLLLVGLQIAVPIHASDSADGYGVPPGENIVVNGNLSFTYDVGDSCLKDISIDGVMVIARLSLPELGWSIPQSFEGGFSTSYYLLTYSAYDEPFILIQSKQEMECLIDGVSPANVSGNTMEMVAGEYRVMISTDGSMRADGKVSLSPGDIVLITFHKREGRDSGQEKAFMEAVSLSKVGAEVSVNGNDLRIFQYDNISVKKLSISDEKWSFSVSSGEHRGRCIVFHLNASLENISVLVDGSPGKEGSYYDALFSSGDEVVWNATENGNSTDIYVYIPSFSEHVVTIQESTSSEGAVPENIRSEPVFIPVLLAVMISAGALFIAILRKR